MKRPSAEGGRCRDGVPRWRSTIVVEHMDGGASRLRNGVEVEDLGSKATGALSGALSKVPEKPSE